MLFYQNCKKKYAFKTNKNKLDFSIQEFSNHFNGFLFNKKKKKMDNTKYIFQTQKLHYYLTTFIWYRILHIRLRKRDNEKPIKIFDFFILLF